MSTKIFISLLFLMVCSSIFAQDLKTKNVILITLDGLRWQEVFSGADSSILESQNESDDYTVTKAVYWNDNEETRRKTLMPFLWSEFATNGMLIGNRNKASQMNLTNKYWFSYPGYNELFTGMADDSVDSNEKKYNPNTTVFEVANRVPSLKGKVAAIASWDCFPYILNSKRCGFYVNGGSQHAEGDITSTEAALNDIMDNTPAYSLGVRYDILTYRYGLEYLKTKHPHLFFMGFDETDDNAHDGLYGKYLSAAQKADQIIKNLWEWLQNDPQYKDQTTLIVTCDHGRGDAENDEWTNHGSTIKGSDQTWMAILGPDTPAIGEMDNGQFYTSQIAKTIAYLLNFNYNAPKAGKPINALFMKDVSATHE